MTEETNKITKGRSTRKALIENASTKLAKAKSIVFTNYQGLSANHVNELRSKLSECGADAGVSKNTLMKIALNDQNINAEEFDKSLKGPTLAVFSYDDPVAGIKVLFDFAKEHDDLPEIKAGLVDGAFASYEKLLVLSTLPSRDQLLAQVVGGLKSPINGIVSTLGGVQRKFVYALSAVAEKKGGQS